MRNPKPKEWLASELSQQYIADYKPFNFVDGEGVRNSLYVSGCPFACEGCFNAASQVWLKVIHRLRSEFGDTKDIWSWSGYTFEELLLDSEDKLEMLSKIDILVDGRFELSKKNLMLQFRGSSNQRIIDVKKSLAKGEVVIWEKLHDSEKAFEQIKKSDLI